MAEKKKTTSKVKELVETVIEEVKEKAEEVIEEVEEAAGLKEKSKKTTKKTPAKKPAEKKSKTALDKLKEKAKALEESVSEEKVDLKEKVKKKSDEPEEKEDGLVPIEDYLKSSIHLGTRVITPDMREFVYKRRADGLAVFNTALLDDKIKEAAEFLSTFPPEDAILVCKREAGWRAAKFFNKITGIRTFTKKYPSGVLTNPNLDDFFETELAFIVDPWLDKNALKDSNNIGIPVLSICDTNNYTAGITKIIPGNNKSAKSIGLILYLIAKLYVETRKISVEIPPIHEWVDDWENLTPPK